MGKGSMSEPGSSISMGGASWSGGMMSTTDLFTELEFLLWYAMLAAWALWGGGALLDF